MLYQLPTGKVIEISTEQYFEMTDEELDYFVRHNYGEVIENPWFGSVLHKREQPTRDEYDDFDNTSYLNDPLEDESPTDLDITD